MSTQRETIARAFEQVQMALLEQQVTLRSQMLEVFGVLGELGEETAELRSRLDRLEKRPPAA
ncbi:MAG: hypothetical protein AMXMBFR33_49740 [Candidatus Xenobia bacterium]